MTDACQACGKGIIEHTYVAGDACLTYQKPLPALPRDGYLDALTTFQGTADENALRWPAPFDGYFRGWAAGLRQARREYLRQQSRQEDTRHA